jgi:hypothetical protein
MTAGATTGPVVAHPWLGPALFGLPRLATAFINTALLALAPSEGPGIGPKSKPAGRVSRAFVNRPG